MLKKGCLICKVVGIFAIIGCLNWGSIGLTGNNFVEGIFGAGSGITKVIYILVGVSGIGLAASFLNLCKKCKE